MQISPLRYVHKMGMINNNIFSLEWKLLYKDTLGQLKRAPGLAVPGKTSLTEDVGVHGSTFQPQ